jgi:Protein of unknown function (DUF4012)
MGIIEPVKIEDRQTIPLKGWRKTHRPKKRNILIACLLFLFLIGSTSAVAGYQAYHTYHTDLLLAQTEMQHLRTAITLLESLQAQPFAPQTVERAQQEFAGALSDAQAIEADLASYAGIAGLVPVYGPRLEAAIHLSALAVDVSKTGIAGCKLLEMVLTRLGSPLNASVSTPGLSSADFITLSNQYRMMKTSLNATINEALLVQPGDVSFDAHLAKLLQEFQASIPTIRTALSEADGLLTALPTLLGIGTPSHYLLEILDSTELRPGGGFIGNYGIATLTGGRLTSAHITDVILLDVPFNLAGHTIPYPPAYSWFAHYLALHSWSLRDSNLDADFPTDARNGEVNFEREGGNVPLQGVIAITPFFIEHVLNVTGPISVPEYHETVTAQNLVSLIHFHQLGGAAAGEGRSLIPSPDGHSSQRKRFTELLGEHLLTRVQRLPSGSMAKFLQLTVGSLRTKDIQLYFNASNAENALHLLHLDGTIQSPLGDHLFLVDANIAPNKANNSIVNSVHDQVTIDEHGNAVHRTTITYAWTLAGQNYGSNLYRDYVRLYVPPGSTLSQQDGWQPPDTSTAFGSQVWAGYFTLVYGQTRTITLVWTSYGVAKQDANGWHYHYLLQRQAGAQRTLDLQVMLPSCAVVANKSGGLVSRGKQEETLTQSLTQDLNVGVDYACK